MYIAKLQKYHILTLTRFLHFLLWSIYQFFCILVTDSWRHVSLFKFEKSIMFCVYFFILYTYFICPLHIYESFFRVVQYIWRLLVNIWTHWHWVVAVHFDWVSSWLIGLNTKCIFEPCRNRMSLQSLWSFISRFRIRHVLVCYGERYIYKFYSCFIFIIFIFPKWV